MQGVFVFFVTSKKGAENLDRGCRRLFGRVRDKINKASEAVQSEADTARVKIITMSGFLTQLMAQ